MAAVAFRVGGRQLNADPLGGADLGTRSFRIHDWSIVPGPPSIRPPFDSLAQCEIAEYSPEQAAAALLAIAGTHLVHPDEPNWWSWRARWVSGQSSIDLAMTLFDPDDGRSTWGGFTLSGAADPGALLAIYSNLHIQLTCSWLYNAECEFHNAESLRQFVGAA